MIDPMIFVERQIGLLSDWLMFGWLTPRVKYVMYVFRTRTIKQNIEKWERNSRSKDFRLELGKYGQ